ncbi:MAG TPA: hypothetical protein VFL55_06965 [Acetobacteraceae bacterium]|nr:hypothetical protein [Acetobacteraceae bacterium]
MTQDMVRSTQTTSSDPEPEIARAPEPARELRVREPEAWHAPSNAWIPWVAALLGFGFQIVWFSSQFGALSARIEDADRRVQSIEQNGSPTVQAIRTEVSINSRRLGNIEDQYATRVASLLSDNAAQNERIGRLQQDVESLKQWRLAHATDDSNSDGRLGALDRQIQQIQAEQSNLIRDLTAGLRSRQR